MEWLPKLSKRGDVTFLAFPGDFCNTTACENTWQLKTVPRPGGFAVWEETPSGKKQQQRLWWQYHRACKKGLDYKQDQCSLCHEYMERAAQGILHASGAVRIPKPGKAWLIWFPDCQRCAGGFMYIHSPYSMNGLSVSS